MASTNRRLSVLFLGAIAAAISACANPAVQECGATGIYCPAGTHCAAAEGVCISDTNTCGDAHTDADEACDDGNTKDGDGCSADCKSNEICGNGIVDTKAGEVCDDGPAAMVNGEPVDGDGCSADCKSNETCGNGITDKAKGEVCDDGNQTDGDDCSGDCKSNERCGNGIVDRSRGEVCDDGNTDNGDSCSSDCRSGAGCGNGVVDIDPQGHPTEECDDGNKDDNDDCRSDCVTNRCGDGFKNIDGSHKEACDAAPTALFGSKTIVPTETADCNIDCTAAVCGDGKVNHHFIPKDALGQEAPGPEQCDIVDINGVSLNDDKSDCTFLCQINVCGDGHQDSTGTHLEECDDGDRIDNNGCTNECKFAGCGDGILGPDEQCDDGPGNVGPGLRCNATCHFNVCGDGDKLIGVEACDDGLGGIGQDSATCDADCTLPVCGDGHDNALAGEGCDDGANNGQTGDTCSVTCHPVTCGNGALEQGEQCDDGANNGAGKRCNANCKLNVCGDGDALVGVEQCDAGSGGIRSDSATCDDDCTFAVCGDNHPNTLAGEGCDDGANNGQTGDTCSVTCHLVTCGNGALEQGEQCDDGTANNGPGERCNANCKFNVCGDGDTLIGVEQCDVGTGGIRSDSVTCDDDCTFAVCGDHHPNTLAGEGCDDGANNGQTGDTCSVTCHPVTCGNGALEQGEQCDDGAANNGAGKRCNANCKLNVCGDGDTLIGVEQCDAGSGGIKRDSATCDQDCTFSLCGDGYQNVTDGERCDDGNTNTCGSCNASCAAPNPSTKATGAIAVIDPGGGGTSLAENIKSGDTFRLDDGFNPTVTFEFITGGGAATGSNVKISFTPGDSANEIGRSVRDTINASAIPTLDITATFTDDDPTVVLTNSRPGIRGNTSIIITKAATSNLDKFINPPTMAGGQGGDCGSNVGCATNADCFSNICNAATRRCL